MYTGSLFKMGLRWALSVTSENSVFILSAKYGLLRLDDQIDPYNLFMGDPHSVTATAVKKQALGLGILDARIYALGGEEYRNVLREVFNEIMFPVPKVGMGYMMQILKRNMGKVPKWESQNEIPVN